MTPLFRWPEVASVGRVIPKERMYAEASVTKAVRQRFIDEVLRVRWAYKLSEESLRLRAVDQVVEIQVFEIELKGDDISDSVLTSIDKSVPSPIIFELHRTSRSRDEVQLAAARKESGVRGQNLSGYFRSAWLPDDSERLALPPSLDLAGLYAQVLTVLLPLSVRPGEELSVAIDRISQVRKLDREIAALDKRVRLEPQFNRKVELRRELRARKAELDELMNENETTSEDATWRN